MSGCSALEKLEREGTAPEHTADRARFSMRFLPPEDGKLPRGLAGKFDGEIVDGGERARLVMDLPTGGSGINGPDGEFIFVDDGRAFARFATRKKSVQDVRWLEVKTAQLEALAPGMEQLVSTLTTDRLLTSTNYSEDEVVGSENVRGVETTIYAFSEDLEEVVEVAGVSEDEANEMRTLIGDELQVRTWLDGRGFIRRLEIPMSMPGDTDPVIVRTDLYEFDGSFEVELPDESEVVRL
jgi:hypothetical protein